jgi:uncharacterized protein (DUF1015 family)
MQILDYNRLVKDLNGHSDVDFLAALEQSFLVKPVADAAEAKPRHEKEFALYLSGQWYSLVPSSALMESINVNDPVKRLDVCLLQDAIFTPHLNILDQRTDKRVDFVGGIRGLAELEKRVNSGECQAAFALHATSIESLMDIADAGEVMPPKSTWFEPKLKSGLVVHVLD